MIVRQADSGKLIRKKGIADFPAAAFPESQYPDFFEALIVDHQTDCNGFDLTDLLQYPGGSIAITPVTYA